MSTVPVLNTDANITGKTLMTAEGTATVTGLKTFDLDPSAPFAVTSGSAVVSNLDADKVDGQDYTSGSWTPVIGGSGGTSGQTYSTASGVYAKIGKICLCNFIATLSAKGTITGTVQLQGLPFTVDSTYYSSAQVQWATLATSWASVFILPSTGTTVCLIRGNTGAAVTGGTSTSNTTDLVTADIAATTSFIGSFVYRTT